MTLRPLHDRILVRSAKAEEVTKGGILLPDTAREKPAKGEVVACGPGRMDETGRLLPIGVKIGDTVLYGKYAGTDVTVDGDDLLMMRESDVFAIVE